MGVGDWLVPLIIIIWFGYLLRSPIYEFYMWIKNIAGWGKDKAANVSANMREVIVYK